MRRTATTSGHPNPPPNESHKLRVMGVTKDKVRTRSSDLSLLFFDFVVVV